MKRTLLIIISIVLCALTAMAQEEQYKLRHDSLFVYESWESIFSGEADHLIINPEVDVYTPYDVEFDGIKKELNKILKDEAVAVAWGDSLWYINSQWLRKNFKGDCKKMRDYVPLYFSSKIAFVQWTGTVVSKFMIQTFDLDVNDYLDNGEIYLLNFENMMVEKVDSNRLSNLLSYYPDLQRRYDSMRDYKETYMIADFFLQYVQRISQDPNVPFLF